MKIVFIPTVNDKLDTQNFEKFEEVIKPVFVRHYIYFITKVVYLTI